MRTQNIVLGVIEQGDEYVLQRRNGKEQVGALGLVGFFGGKIEPGEAENAAVVREISEETSLVTMPDDWQKLGDVAVDVLLDGETIHFPATVFKTTVSPEVEIVAKEGEIVRADREFLDFDPALLTPATAEAFKELL